MKIIYTLLMSIPFLCQGQNCSDFPPSTLTADFEKNDDSGTVTHSITGLMWQVCDYGQTVEGGKCIGNAEQLNWQQALLAAKASNQGGYDDWHLPSIKELASIVEHNCVEPALNLNVFTGAQNANYWTNTTAVNKVDYAWAYQFSDGKNNLKNKTSDIFVRLVRYAK
jgi:hypothetical protein